NSYHPKDDCFSKDNPYKQKFAKLLFEINKIKGIKRINFVSSHPKDMDEDLIKALALPRMSNYLHLALQSGDNFILEKMNRGYTIEKYKKLIQKVRQVRPGIAIGTDLIVGFPGESEDQFNNTVKAYCEIDFDIAYTAMYSPRKGTKAAEMKDNVSLKKKKERWQKVQKLMEETTLKKNQKYVGKNVEVLVDKISTNSVQGNSSEMKRVKIKDCQAKLGDIVKVKIKQAQEWLLIA
ncbi:MAG TPA: radical SAM protein, partial [Patescibacteria group bacterium]|nr:radical SAM protein [Patescibacteria group bacterium]